MNKSFLCPRSELCRVYQIYVEKTNNSGMGVVSREKMENCDYYGCGALAYTLRLRRNNKLSKEDMARIPEDLG